MKPNWLDKTLNWVGLQRKNYTGVVDSNFFMRGQTLAEAVANANTGNTDQSYRKHAIVYSAIHACALNLSQVPFRFYQGSDLEREVVENSPYDALFARPNPYMSRFALWEATVTFMKLRGEAMWVLDFGGGNHIGAVPTAIYPMDPALFQPIVQGNQLVAWKMQSAEGVAIFEHGTEVLQFKKFNPYSKWRGLSPLEAAARSVNMGQNIRAFNDSLIENGAEPGGVLTTDDALTGEQMRAFRTQFQERHAGPSNPRRLAILHSGLKYQQIGMTVQDMAFRDLDTLSIEDILAVLRVPKIEVFKYDDVRKETADTQDRVFWTKNLLPEMMYLEDELYASFFSKRGSGKIWGLFDTKQVPALQGSLADKASTAQALFGLGYPINDINRVLDLGMEPVTWGNVGYLPFSIVPADQIGDSHEPAAPVEPPAKQLIVHRGLPGRRWTEVKTIEKPVVKVVAPVKHPMIARVDKVMSQASRQAAWQMFVRSLAELEMRCESKFKRIFFEMRQGVLAELFRVNRSAIRPELSHAVDEAKKNVTNAAKVLYQQSAEIGMKRIAEFGLSFDLPSDQVQKLVAERTGRITGVIDTVERQLRQELSQGVQGGETVTQLSSRVRNVLNLAAHRASTIARTEIAGSANQAGLLSMREARVERLQWVTAGDEAVRESHRAIDGEVVMTGQHFRNGLQYPGQQTGNPDESINCRCTTVPVMDR